jgi:hypothetical protein
MPRRVKLIQVLPIAVLLLTMLIAGTLIFMWFFPWRPTPKTVVTSAEDLELSAIRRGWTYEWRYDPSAYEKERFAYNRLFGTDIRTGQVFDSLSYAYLYFYAYNHVDWSYTNIDRLVLYDLTAGEVVKEWVDPPSYRTRWYSRVFVRLYGPEAITLLGGRLGHSLEWRVDWGYCTHTAHLRAYWYMHARGLIGAKVISYDLGKVTSIDDLRGVGLALDLGDWVEFTPPKDARRVGGTVLYADTGFPVSYDWTVQTYFVTENRYENHSPSWEEFGTFWVQTGDYRGEIIQTLYNELGIPVGEVEFELGELPKWVTWRVEPAGDVAVAEVRELVNIYITIGATTRIVFKYDDVHRRWFVEDASEAQEFGRTDKWEGHGDLSIVLVPRGEYEHLERAFEAYRDRFGKYPRYVKFVAGEDLLEGELKISLGTNQWYVAGGEEWIAPFSFIDRKLRLDELRVVVARR